MSTTSAAEFSFFSWKKTELLAVTLVISLIVGVSYFQLRIGEMKTRDAQRKADTELIGRALEAFYLDHQIYPRATEDGKIISCGKDGAEACGWGNRSVMVDEDNVAYLKDIPAEPQSYKGKKYVYIVNESRDEFELYAALEYSRDPNWKANLGKDCGGTQCSWVVTDD